MIKRITLKNFESHEDSAIEFSDGLNLIIGQSNQGKSSIVRALAMVVANRFDRDSVRTGAKYCSVAVETEKGMVTAERGEDTNHWIIETPQGKKEYRNIGSSVPSEVLEVLGMGERARGEIKELPNIMFQLEKHYMLSEIDGKKTTANSIARMMDEAIGIGGMEELIKDIATDFAAKKRDLETKNIQISEIRSKILDANIFEGYKRSMEDTKAVFDEIESLNNLLDSAKELSCKVELNKEGRNLLERRLNCSEGIDILADKIGDLIKKFRMIFRAFQIMENLDQAGKRIIIYDSVNDISCETEIIIRNLEKLKTAKDLSRKLNELQRSLSADADFDKNLNMIESQQGNISNAKKMLRNARELYKKIRNISYRLIESEKELKEAEFSFSELKKQLGQCPLCGGEL